MMIPELKLKLKSAEEEISNQFTANSTSNLIIDLTDSPSTLDSSAQKANMDMVAFQNTVGIPVPNPNMFIGQDILMPRPSPRRAKRLVPEQSKDYRYWEKRKKNNEAAKRSRENRRKIDYDIRQRMVYCEEENSLLKKELGVIKTRFNLSSDKRYLSVDAEGELVGEEMTAIDISGYDFEIHDHMDGSNENNGDEYQIDRQQKQTNNDNQSDIGFREESPKKEVSHAYLEDHIPMKKRRLRLQSSSDEVSTTSPPAMEFEPRFVPELPRSTFIPHIPQLNNINHNSESQFRRTSVLTPDHNSSYEGSISGSHSPSSTYVKSLRLDVPNRSPSSGYETGSNGSISPKKPSMDNIQLPPLQPLNLHIPSDLSGLKTHKAKNDALMFAFERDKVIEKLLLNVNNPHFAVREERQKNEVPRRHPHEHIPSLIHDLIHTSNYSHMSYFNQHEPHDSQNNTSSHRHVRNGILSQTGSCDVNIHENRNKYSEDKQENDDLRLKLLALSAEVESMKKVLLNEDKKA